MQERFTIAGMQRKDWTLVRRIYAEGLASGLAAFTLDPPTWKNWDSGHFDFARCVARSSDNQILGWSALSPVPDT